MSKDRPYSALVQRLKAAGLRPTRQRLALAKLLFDSGDRHVTAETLHEEALHRCIPVSLATVYNTLHQFTKAIPPAARLKNTLLAFPARDPDAGFCHPLPQRLQADQPLWEQKQLLLVNLERAKSLGLDTHHGDSEQGIGAGEAEILVEHQQVQMRSIGRLDRLRGTGALRRQLDHHAVERANEPVSRRLGLGAGGHRHHQGQDGKNARHPDELTPFLCLS